MPRSRWKRPRIRAELLVALTALSQPAFAAPPPDWFGLGCPVAAPQAVPPQVSQQLLVLVHTEPGAAGSEEILLATPDGEIWAQAPNFATWGLRVQDTEARIEYGTSWYRLSAVGRLIFRFDHCRQELWLDSSLVPRNRRLFAASHTRAPALSKVNEPGGFLNLDTQYVGIAHDDRFAGQAELGFFDRAGFGLSSLLNDGSRTVRLENSLTLDRPEWRERFRLGDSISRAGILGRSVRFGGIQWGSDFSLQPDLITFPLPSVQGLARLPSAVDVYVDQSLRARQDVPSGPFELTNLPVVSGAGELQLVVRDALGRSQIISYPFYASPLLLRKGLPDYSLQGGWLRQNFGAVSADYGEGFVAGTLRRGLSDHLTGEVRADALSGQQTAGVALTGAAPGFGAWTAGLSASHSRQGTGALAVLAHEYLSRFWSYAAEARFGSPAFVQIGDTVGDLRHSTALRFGFSPHANGSLSVFYIAQNRRMQQKLDLFGLNYSWNLSRAWFFNAGVTRSRTAALDQTAALTLNYQWDGRSTATLQRDQGNSGVALTRISLQSNAPGPLGVGYRLFAEDSILARNGAGVRWGTGKGIITGDIEQVGGVSGQRLGFATGIAALGKDFFWTRPVTGSFAVVDSGSVSQVRVYSENRLVGRTDAGGVLLVPDLRAFEANQLQIDVNDVPVAYEVPALTAEVRPPARSGVRALLAARPSRNVALRVELAGGQAPPAGAQVKLDGVPASLPLGYGGIAYVTAAPGRHVLELRWPQGTCRAEFELASAAVPVMCREEN